MPIRITENVRGVLDDDSNGRRKGEFRLTLGEQTSIIGFVICKMLGDGGFFVRLNRDYLDYERERLAVYRRDHGKLRGEQVWTKSLQQNWPEEKAKSDASPHCRAVERWFGDVSPGWVTLLRMKCLTISSLVNQSRIVLDLIPPSSDNAHRCGGQHATWSRFSKAGASLGLPSSGQRECSITLEWDYRHVPMYPSKGDYGVSMFTMLIHECTHLFLPESRDICYGPQACQALAKTSPELAKANSDNWAYFSQDMFELEFSSLGRQPSSIHDIPEYFRG
jgi:hypothetical protein